MASAQGADGHPRPGRPTVVWPGCSLWVWVPASI